jgi:hypothetical protein
VFCAFKYFFFRFGLRFVLLYILISSYIYFIPSTNHWHVAVLKLIS